MTLKRTNVRYGISPTPGEDRRERAHDGHEAGEQDRLRPVHLEEVLGALDVLLFEQPRVRAPEQDGPDPLAEHVADLVAEDGRDEAADEQDRQVEAGLVLGRRAAGGEQERVAGEEEADEQAGLGEDDEEQPDRRRTGPASR